MKDYTTFLKNRVTAKSITTKHLRESQIIQLFLALLSDCLLHRNHCNRSPHGTYSITRNLCSCKVQQPTRDTIFWCVPSSFISSISCKNSSFWSSLGSSKNKRWSSISTYNEYKLFKPLSTNHDDHLLGFISGIIRRHFNRKFNFIQFN